MQSKPLSVYDLFDHKRRYVVPLFQRQYVWSHDNQWEPLWDDVRSKAVQRLEKPSDDNITPHFLGAMVLNQMQTFGNAVPSYTIIDGQQRLTTFQIFLAAFRDVSRQHNAVNFAEEIERYVRNTGLMENEAVERFKVFPTKADQTQFIDVMTAGARDVLEVKYPPLYVRRRLQDRPRMVEAYLYFTKAIDDFLAGADEEGQDSDEASQARRVEALFQALRRDLLVVSIELEGKDDPQLIFETLNARGEPLLPSDLLRNYIFRRAEQNHENQDALYEEYWTEFEQDFWRVEEKQGRLTRARIDIFMQHFLALKKATDINVGHMFQEYRAWIKDQKPYPNVKAELVDLLRYAGAFRRIINPDPATRFGVFMQRLQILDVRTIFPLSLYLLADAPLTQQELDDIAADLEAYLVRRAVCGKTTKNYNRTFLLIVREFQQRGTSRQTLREIFLSYKGDAVVFPDDAEFKRAWLSVPVYEKLKPSKVSVLLRAIENSLHNSFAEDIQINTPLTVEHVMPQSWEENWPLDSTATSTVLDLVADPTNAEAVRDQIVQTFGNLTLLTHALNASVSNASFEVKRPEITVQSLLKLNAYFQSAEGWNEATIKQRGEHLFNIARQIWAYPALDVT